MTLMKKETIQMMVKKMQIIKTRQQRTIRIAMEQCGQRLYLHRLENEMLLIFYEKLDQSQLEEVSDTILDTFLFLLPKIY